MPQDFRDQFVRLEAIVHADGEHTKETLKNISSVQDKMLGVLGEMAGTQREMKHIGMVIDKHSERLDAIETKKIPDIEKTQEIHKVVVAIAVFVSSSMLLAVFSKLFT